MPGTCDHVTSHGKRVSQMRLRIVKWEDYPGLSIYNPSVITGVLTRGRQECQSQRRRCDKRVRVQREEAISQGMQAPLEAGKGKGQILPSSLQKEHSPADPFLF